MNAVENIRESKGFSWTVKAGASGRERSGVLQTPHFSVQTPAFMPVGSLGTVKAVTPDDLIDANVEIICANTYHLYLRPGYKLIESLGGLHNFMGWERAVLTDSGGFQAYSLMDSRDISEDGISFRSTIDGSWHLLSPELAMEVQSALGSDIAMVLDECLPYPASYGDTERSCALTTRWALRCRSYPRKEGQALFGIVQGGMFPDLRKRNAEELIALDFDGYAIGGLSVGEERDKMLEIVEKTAEMLPQDKIRYLMGVGKPEDIVEAVALGIDLFDCVIPTRNARNGTLYTWNGSFSIKKSSFATDGTSLDPSCKCYTCRNFSKAYLRHLWTNQEPLSFRLNTIHNIYFYQELMREIRRSIEEERFSAFKKEFFNSYGGEHLCGRQ